MKGPFWRLRVYALTRIWGFGVLVNTKSAFAAIGVFAGDSYLSDDPGVSLFLGPARIEVVYV